MKKIILFALMASMMMFTGCKKSEEAPKPKDDAAVDLGGDVILKVGESELTDNQFIFFLDNVKSQMQGTELSTEESWETAEIEGRKAIEVAKERAYEIAVDYLSGIEVAKKKGLTYTEEEMTELKSYINTAYFDQYTDSESIIKLMCEYELYIGKLQEAFVQENPVDDAEIEAYFNEHKEELSNQYLRAKHVLFLTQNEETQEVLPDAEIAEKKKQADDILARAKQGEDFDALVSQYSEDPGSHQQPEGYVFTSGEMMQEFEDCVRSLGFNEIGFTETSYGYHIIKRLDLDVSSCKDIISNSIYSEKFEAYIDNLREEYKIEITKNDDEYNSIK